MHLDLPLDVQTVEELKKDVMNVHVFFVGEYDYSGGGSGLQSLSNLDPSKQAANEKENGKTEKADETEVTNGNNEAPIDTTNNKMVGEPINLDNETNTNDDYEEYRQKMVESIKVQKYVEDIDKDILDVEKNEQMLKEVYKLGDRSNNAAAKITIPEEVEKFYNDKERMEEEPTKKKAKIDATEDNLATDQDFVPVEEMLKDFKPVFI